MVVEIETRTHPLRSSRAWYNAPTLPWYLATTLVYVLDCDVVLTINLRGMVDIVMRKKIRKCTKSEWYRVQVSVHCLVVGGGGGG